MDGKSIIDALIALILYIVFAIIYFIILSFIVNFGAGLVGDGDVGAPMVAVSASILTAGTLIAGGGMMDIFKRP